MSNKLKLKHWLRELLWVLLSGIFSLLMIFIFLDVDKKRGVSIQISDTYFVTDFWLSFCVIFSVVGSVIFLLHNTISKFKRLLRLVLLTCFIGFSFYWMHQLMPTETVQSDSGWVLMPPYSSLSTSQKLDVLGNMFFKGVWAVWLYFGLIVSFIALLGRIFWLARAAKRL